MKEGIKRWFSRRVNEQIKELASEERSGARVAIAVFVIFTLIVLYFVVHQVWATGFFTNAFGTLEMFLFYGSWIEWIAVAALEGMSYKHLARDIDAFGGLVFVTIGAMWLFAVFPFEFVFFADVLPDFLRFLVQWLSIENARIVMVLWITVNLMSAVYYGILRVVVRRELRTRTRVLA